MLPLLGILGAYAVLTLNPQRQDRYMLPAVPLVAALAGSGRLRAWLAPVAVVGAYGAAAMFLQSGTAPAERRFDHDLVSVGMDWPWPHEAYRPLSLDPGPWRVDETLLQMREAHGRDDGTVGLLLDDLRGAPGMGLFLFRAGALGFRWDLATVMVDFMPGAGGQLRSDVFVGPFATDDWPSREFDVLVAVVRPSDLARASWLRQAGVEEIASWELPGEFEGRLLRIVGP
jgi:hypothetical protein